MKYLNKFQLLEHQYIFRGRHNIIQLKVIQFLEKVYNAEATYALSKLINLLPGKIKLNVYPTLFGITY